MQAKTIVYYFTLTSPWAWLGHQLLHDIASRQGCTLDYRPISLGQVFPATGGLPLAKRAPARQAYRLLELQRWRVQRSVAINQHPKFFPFDPGLADRTVVAILGAGHNPENFVRQVFEAVFVQDRNLADADELASLLERAGLDAMKLLERAVEPSVIEQYEANSAQALAQGIFGSPSYVLGGEVFWGQDRLELLEAALASGRAPYLPV